MATAPDGNMDNLVQLFHQEVGKDQYQKLMDASPDGRVNLDKAVELELMEPRAKIKALGLPGLQDEFKDVMARKMEKEYLPKLEAFMLAYKAVFGRLRGEEQSKSEQKEENGKDSQLMKALYRVLKFKEGIKEGTLAGKHDLRIAAVALDDAMAAFREAKKKTPELEKALKEATEKFEEASSRSTALDGERSTFKGITEEHLGGPLGRFLDARKNIEVDRSELERWKDGEAQLTKTRDEAERACDSYLMNVPALKSAFQDLLVQSTAARDNKLSKILSATIARIELFEARLKTDSQGWQAFLDDHFAEALDKVSKSQLSSNEHLDSAHESAKLLMSGASCVDRYHESREAKAKAPKLKEALDDAEAQINAYMEHVTSVEETLVAISKIANERVEPHVVEKAASLSVRVSEFSKSLKSNPPASWKEFVQTELQGFVDRLSDTSFAEGTQAALQNEGNNMREILRESVSFLSSDVAVVGSYQDIRSKWFSNKVLTVDGDKIEADIDGYLAVVSDVWDGLDQLAVDADIRGDTESRKAIRAVTAKFQNFESGDGLKGNADGWHDFVSGDILPLFSKLQSSPTGTSEALWRAKVSGDRLSEGQAILHDYASARNLSEKRHAEYAEVRDKVDKHQSAIDAANRGEIWADVFAIADKAVKFVEPGMKKVSPEIYKLCSEYVEFVNNTRSTLEVGGVEHDPKLIDLVANESADFIEKLKSLFEGLDNEAKAYMDAHKGLIDSMNVELTDLKELDEEKYLEKILHATFPGLKYKFKGKLGTVFKQLDSARNWLDDDEKDEKKDNAKTLVIASQGLRSAVGKVNTLDFKRTVRGLKINVPLVKTGNVGKIVVKRVNVPALLSEVKAQIQEREALVNMKFEKSDQGQRDEVKTAAKEKAKLQEIQKSLEEVLTLTTAFHAKMDTLSGHLEVAITAKMKFQGVAAEEVNDAIKIIKAADKENPYALLEAYEKVKGCLEDSDNVMALRGEFGRVRGEIEGSSGLTDNKAARKLVSAIMSMEDDTLSMDEANDLATGVIKGGVSMLNSKKSLMQMVRELNPKTFENLKGMFIKEKLIDFALKKGEKVTKPFENAKIEDFESWAGLKKYLEQMTEAKGDEWVFEHSFYILAAFEHFEGTEGLKASDQRVNLEIYMKNALAERRLEDHPEFTDVNDAMASPAFSKNIEEEFAEMRRHGKSKFTEFSDKYDSKGAYVRARKVMRIKKSIKELKARRRANEITKTQFDDQLTKLLDEAAESGIKKREVGVWLEWRARFAANGLSRWAGEKFRNARSRVGRKLGAIADIAISGTVGAGAGLVEKALGLVFRIPVVGLGVPAAFVGASLRKLVSLPVNALAWPVTSARWKPKGVLETTKSVVGKMKIGGYLAEGSKNLTTGAIAAGGKMAKDKWAAADTDKTIANRKEKEAKEKDKLKAQLEELAKDNELEAVEVAEDPFKKIKAKYDKKHKSLAEMNRPDSMRQARTSDTRRGQEDADVA